MRVLFIHDSQPVSNLRVCRATENVERETDDDGQLDLDLAPGTHTLHVFTAGNWVPQTVNVTSDSSLLIVDVGRRATDEALRRSQPMSTIKDIGKLNLGERYVFERVIGHGGMSIVLLARDRLLDRPVAVKMLVEELQHQPEAQNIFLTEARNLATLAHPNLVAVHDICKVDGRVFMVIEHVQGENLERLVHATRGLEPAVALRIIIQLTRVLSYLHDHGIVHRDIKPSNAMIRHDGTVKLIDFGLARHFNELYIRGTRVRGTPAYMSPEQIQGHELSPASDIYALGVTLFEILSAQLPFETGDMGYAHVHLEPPKLDDVLTGLPSGLSGIIDQCMAKDPRERPRDAHDLLETFQAIYQRLTAPDAEMMPRVPEVGPTQHTPRPNTNLLASIEALERDEFAARRETPPLSKPAIVRATPAPAGATPTRRTATLVTLGVVLGIIAAVVAIVALEHHTGARDDAPSPATQAAVALDVTEPPVPPSQADRATPSEPEPAAEEEPEPGEEAEAAATTTAGLVRDLAITQAAIRRGEARSKVTVSSVTKPRAVKRGKPRRRARPAKRRAPAVAPPPKVEEPAPEVELEVVPAAAPKVVKPPKARPRKPAKSNSLEEMLGGERDTAQRGKRKKRAGDLLPMR